MAPSNDFHGKVEDVTWVIDHAKSEDTNGKLVNWKDLVGLMLKLGTGQGLPEFEKIYWKSIPEEEFLKERPFQLGENIDTDGGVMLTFKDADHVVGRIDEKNESVKSDMEGLQVHSPSELVYFLKGQFKNFVTTLVSGEKSSVSYKVYAEEKKVYESEVRRGDSEPLDIDVDITGAQELKLIVTDVGNGWGGDWVMRGEPFYK